MTEYTPRLDGLITAYSKHLEKQTQDAVNPDTGAAMSLLRMSFRAIASGDVLLAKIYDTLGWKNAPADPYAIALDLADIAERHGNLETAARLKKCAAAIDAAAHAAEASGGLPEGAGHYQILKTIKKLDIRFY